MTRRLRIVLASAIVLVGLGVIVVLSVVGVTHTGFGQERVRAMVSTMLAGQVKGRVYIGRMSGGFFNGVTIDSLEIRDDEDSVFVASGPIRVSYDPRDLFDRRILLSNLQVQHPVVHLRQHKNGDWNWRRIFPASVEKQKRNERGFGQYVVIDSSEIQDATFTLTIPWSPSDTLHGAKLDSAIRFELTRKDHEIRRTREGFARTWRWTNAQASVGFARIADPDTVGRLVRLRNASFTETDPPFKFRNILGTFLNLGDSLFVDAEHFDLPRSTGRAHGSVVWGGNQGIRYYLHVVGDSVALGDVAWVYPTLPTAGGGKMELDIRSERDPRIVDYVLTKMDVRTTGSRLLGQMTFAVGDPILAVKNVDLQAAPVDFDLLRTLNGKPFPYDWQGKITGNVKGAGGPLNHFKVDESSLTFADAHVPGAITKASGDGELNILEPAFTAFHDFHVDVATLDLRTLQYLNPLFPKIKGTVSGTANLDSSWLDVRFRNADLLHHDGAQPVSHITGNGRVTWGKYLIYDLALQAQPLSFTALAHSYPLLPLRGSYAGPVQVKGTSPNLLVNTTLTGPAGTFAYNGSLDADPVEYAARGRATTTALDLRTLLEKNTLPHTQLTGQYDIDWRGESLATLAGSAAASIERSTVAGFRVDPSIARVHLAKGVATVDTLALNAAGLRAHASGTFGMTGTHTGTLKFSAVMDSLSRLRALVPSLATNAAVDSLHGSAELTGELSGSIEHLGLNGIVRANDVSFGTRGVESIRGSILLADVTKNINGSLVFGADTVSLGPVGFHNIRASIAVASPTSGHFGASMLSESGVQTELAGNLTRSRDTTIVRLDSASVLVDSANRYRLQYPTRIQFSKGFLALDSLLLQHSSKAKLVVENVRMNTESIKGHVRTDSVDLRLVRAFVPGLVDARGAIVADVDIRGSLKQPQLFGYISLGDGFARFSNLGTSYDHIAADIALSGDTVHVRKLAAETVKDRRRGTVSVTGTVSFEHYDNPSFSLTANASNFHAIEKPGLAALDISTGPPVRLTGSTQNAVMRGSVRVERGTIYIPDVIKKQIIDLNDPEFQNTVDTLLSQNREVLPRAPKAVARNLRLENVTVDIGPDVWLRSSEANIKLGGSLNVTLAPPNPGEPPKLALEGQLGANKGTYRLNLVDPFIQPTFDVQSGQLRFFGTSDLNPSLDIKAIHTVRQPSKSVNGRDVRVEVDITGTLAQPKLALRNPDNLPLSESDLLSYLVTGEPAVGLDNTTGQVAGLGVRALGNIFTNAIPRQLLDIVEVQTAVNTDPTISGGTATNSPYFGLLNTRAVLGKQLGSRWFLGLSTGLCFVNPSAFKENLGLQLEYRISSLYSAQAAIEPGSSNTRCDKGTAPSFTPTQTPSQLGFDFFRNWRF